MGECILAEVSGPAHRSSNLHLSESHTIAYVLMLFIDVNFGSALSQVQALIYRN